MFLEMKICFFNEAQTMSVPTKNTANVQRIKSQKIQPKLKIKELK
jgi:hypothetical protein